MTTKTFGPLLEIARIQSEINRLFNNLLDLGVPGQETGAWIPNADILETQDALLVMVELPGVEAADLALSVHGGNIIMKGEKKRQESEEQVRFHAVERAFGRFRRVINLGAPVNTHQAEAVLQDGLLRIRFPKVPNRRGQEVPVEVKTP
jgi:HSP20 family protein